MDTLNDDFISRIKALDEIAEKSLGFQLTEYLAIVELSVDCGIEIPCLIQPTSSHRLAGYFLRRALNDLWIVSKLINQGYTSQAAAVTCSLMEHCAHVTIILGRKDLEEEIREKMSNGEMGSYKNGKDLFDLLGKVSSRSMYPVYKWLNKLKHPSLVALTLEANSLSSDKSKYLITVNPVVSDRDLGNKKYILCNAINETRSAIWVFGENGNLNYKDPKVIVWGEKMDRILNFIQKGLEECQGRLTYDLKATIFAKNNWKEIMGEDYPY